MRTGRPPLRVLNGTQRPWLVVTLRTPPMALLPDFHPTQQGAHSVSGPDGPLWRRRTRGPRLMSFDDRTEQRDARTRHGGLDTA